MNELALFAGAGGGLLGSKLLGWRAVCYVENDAYCVQVIQQRIRDGMLDDAPIWDDVRTFDGKPWAGCVDIVTGGFPCQPWSVAGKRAGELDERNLWPDTLCIINEVRPEWCLLENVPGLLSRSYIRRIYADLAESGYDTRWDCIPAAFVGAPHIRKRLWIVAHANIEQHKGDPSTDKRQTAQELFTNTKRQRLEEPGYIAQADQLAEIDWWAVEPGLGRVADGVANRVDRLRAIGNGQVPAVVRAAWRLMS